MQKRKKEQLQRAFGNEAALRVISWDTKLEQSIFGVLTAGDSRYFPGLHAIALLLREQGIPLAIADHGLKKEEVERLWFEGAVVIDNTLPAGLMELAAVNTRACSCAQAWGKPWVCTKSPFEITMWIDADALPLQGIRTMFDLGNSQGFVTRNHWSLRNAEVYRRPIRLLGREENPVRYFWACEINSGVFLYHRASPWIEAWWHCTLEFLTRRIASNTRDQSALVVTFATEDVDAPELLWDAKYNQSANHLKAPERLNRKLYGSPIDLEAVRRDHPEDYIVHWLGRPKAWD